MIHRLWFWALLLPLPGLGQEVLIPGEELAHAPSSTRIAALVDSAGTQGWGAAVPALRTAALEAYERSTGYAPAWYYLYRWAELLGTPQGKAIHDWVGAVEAARVAHPNMARSYESKPGSLAALLSRELQLALLGNGAFSEEFFSVLSPVDNPVQVLAILEKIHATEPALFAEYQSLALAVAVVYDVPPPPHWPHGQVEAAVLPRTLPPPERAFAYWARLDRANFTMQRLRRLPAGELKFLVDTVSPFADLDWARKNVPPGLGEFEKVYGMIKYRKDRLEQNLYLWPGADYRLATILQLGGICVDQAYFASTAGKAKGIPTILFLGAGADGRHAWFGYLDAGERWHLDCGRYAEQKYVVGVAVDPQTWGPINDYELLFITERFRALPLYKLSVMHANFAWEYLQARRPDLARKAAREAVNRERRNLQAWRILAEAQRMSAPADLRGQEAVLREAAMAFQKYPDLENDFAKQVAEVQRARGEGSGADFEAQRRARKYSTARVDLSIQAAADALEQSMKADDVVNQIRTFNKVLAETGAGAGIDYYDKVVAPFIRHLASVDQTPAALQSLDRARRTLRVEPGRQLDLEMAGLASQIKGGKVR